MTTRRLRWVALGLGLLASVWWIVRAEAPNDAERFVTVTRGDLLSTIEVEGTLAAVHSNFLAPPPVVGLWQYEIARMAPDGADVKEGEPVLTFDTSELERRLLQMNAALETATNEIEKKRTNITIRRSDDDIRLAEARAKREKAELKLERPEELVAAKEIATLELDRDLARQEVSYLENRRRLLDQADEVELGILREERDRAALRVRDLQNGIDRLTLRSPRNGTVIHVTDRGGEKKRVGDSVWIRDQVLEIPDLNSMMARGMVDEADAGRLELGQRVQIRLDAHPDVVFGGEIKKIAKTVQPRTRNSPLRVVSVDIALDETDPTRMRPEMRFRGTVEIGRQENVLLVPAGAVRQISTGAAVLRRSFSGVEERPVELGDRNSESVAIVQGLAEGDEVLTQW